MSIKPIRTEADHAAALREIEALWDCAVNTPENDRLEVLAILVEDYERRRWPVPTSTPLEILRYAVSEMGHSQSELAVLLGSRSRASELLTGKRRMSLDVVQKISAGWHIPADLLIQPYDLVA